MNRAKVLGGDVVRPLERSETPAPPQDTRSFWQRLLRGARPTVEIETIKRTGQKELTIGVKTSAEF